MELARTRSVAVEVCPISNQMLRLLDDTRDHPAVAMMNSGVPVTLANDDPLQFGMYLCIYVLGKFMNFPDVTSLCGTLPWEFHNKN